MSRSPARRFRTFAIAGLAAMTVLPATGCMLFGLEGLDSSQGALTSFGSCTDLEAHLKAMALRRLGIVSDLGGLSSAYDPMGFAGSIDGGSTPNQPNLPFDGTNDQEAGVDEADIFQVDATHAFALNGGRLVIIQAWGSNGSDPGSDGPAAFDSASEGGFAGGEIVAEVDIDGSPIEMFLIENRVVVIARTSYGAMAQAYAASGTPDRPSGAATTVAYVYDVTNRANPQLERSVAVDGQYLSARHIDGQVYVVARAMLGGPSGGGSNDGPLAFDLGAAALLGADLDDWMPYTYTTTFAGNGVAAQSVDRASCGSTYAAGATPGEDALGIVSFDVSNPQSQPHTTTILGDGAIVYASQESIVVALTNYGAMQYPVDEDEPRMLSAANSLGIGGSVGGGGLGGGGITGGITGSNGFTGGGSSFSPGDWGTFGFSNEGETNAPSTWLHRFELAADGSAVYDATGRVDGWILSQFSLSEENGYVRVATYDNPQVRPGTAPTDAPTGGDISTMVFTLRVGGGSSNDDGPAALLGAAADLGSARSRLSVAGELRDIAPGEQLYAVRFRGNFGYLVTFQQTDPLWIIDLSSPTSPRIRGELMVPGWSTYLHPIPGSKLLAIGRGGFWNDEIKLSLFDVSNPDSPSAVEEIIMGTSGADSEALTEHRAFRYLEDRQLLAIPVDIPGRSTLRLVRVDNNNIDEVAFVDHGPLGGDSIRRAYRIGDFLYSYSEGGVIITDLDSFESVATVQF